MSAAGIVGLGLIGGSLARDLAASGWRVLGDDRDPDRIAEARTAGVVTAPLRPSDLDSLDLLVLAVPVRAAGDRVRSLAASIGPESDLVITDVGSTKRTVIAAAESTGLGARFVGSHPMAGSHESGWSASREGLFLDSTVWICPTSASRPGAVAAVEQMWKTVGALPHQLPAPDHDRLLARTSHLPQLTATALATVLARYGIARHQLGPGGRDTTRLAGSDPDVWTDIALDNADEIAPTLQTLARELTELAEALRSGSTDSIRTRLQQSNTWSTTPP